MSDEKTEEESFGKICIFAGLDSVLLKMKISMIDTAPQLAVWLNIDVETARNLLTEWAYKPHIEGGDE